MNSFSVQSLYVWLHRLVTAQGLLAKRESLFSGARPQLHRVLLFKNSHDDADWPSSSPDISCPLPSLCTWASRSPKAPLTQQSPILSLPLPEASSRALTGLLEVSDCNSMVALSMVAGGDLRDSAL